MKRSIILLLIITVLFSAAPGKAAAGTAEETHRLELKYDDRADLSGKAVEITDAGVPLCEGETVIKLENGTLIACGVGTASVKIDGTEYEVRVGKAKLNIIVIMGQSNAGNHFANATSDITCPAGTAYWWGGGKGASATEPVDYTQPSKGFHTPLIAELYAQSAAAGDPVKNVMIWEEGVTSKNGKSITAWASTAENTHGTDAAATMIKNCIDYYESRNDRFEIKDKIVYWLQGESDVDMDPVEYEKRFLAMWNRLKDAGMEYMAFLRVRKGVSGYNAERYDLDYTGSLTAQLDMANRYPDMFIATTLTENWTGNEKTEHSVDISRYVTLMHTYGGQSGLNDAFGNAATFENGVLTTTMKTLYGSNNKCHYGKFGYALIGADAAYNTYRALHGGEISFVMADTSGYAERQITSPGGETVRIDFASKTDALSFRAGCGSKAGTLKITVKSGDTDITDAVTFRGTNDYGALDTGLLAGYERVSVDAVYTATDGTTASVKYVSPDLYELIVADLDGDGTVDSEDAYRLLKYVLYPLRYDVKAVSPFYGGRAPTSDDAVFLLRHVLFPENYPLA